MVLAATASGGTKASTFTDPAGDSGTAPDITTVVVDADAAGTIVLAITTANQADLAADGVLDIVFDADRNGSTGSPSGGEYRLLIFGQDKTFDFLHWDGTQWADASAASLKIVHAPNIFGIVINKSDLGGTGAFDFYVVGVQLAADGSVTARDDAPDGSGVWTFTLVAPPPPPPPPTTTTTPTTPPPPPPPPPPTIGLGGVSLAAVGLHAGKLFLVKAHVTTTAGTVKVTCAVKVSGKAVRVLVAYARATHTATCSGRAPLATVGKRLAGTMTVTISGDRDSRTFAFTIRK
jgi:hypothetical protein